MKNEFYTNTSTLLHLSTPLTYPLLYNKDMIIDLYKLYFSFSPFFLQPNKEVFHPLTFPPLQPNTREEKSNLFYSLTFPSSF